MTRTGDIWLQAWFEVNGAAAWLAGIVQMRWCTLSKFTTVSNGVTIHKLAAYRNDFLARAVKGSSSSYSDVFALMPLKRRLVRRTPPTWMASFRTWSNGCERSRFTIPSAELGSLRKSELPDVSGYKPTNGKWRLIIWDMNIVLATTGRGRPARTCLSAPVAGRT